MRPKIYISGIDNLTDARYFAAMGADYLGFSVDEPSMLLKALGMVEWVQGPQIVAESNALELPIELLEAFRNKHFQHIKVGPFTPLEGVNGLAELIFLEGEISKIQPNIIQIVASTTSEMLSDSNTYLRINLEDYKNHSLPPIAGFVIQAGTEEKIGIKDFDLFDQFFESFEELF